MQLKLVATVKNQELKSDDGGYYFICRIFLLYPGIKIGSILEHHRIIDNDEHVILNKFKVEDLSLNKGTITLRPICEKFEQILTQDVLYIDESVDSSASESDVTISAHVYYGKNWRFAKDWSDKSIPIPKTFSIGTIELKEKCYVYEIAGGFAAIPVSTPVPVQ